MLCQAQSEIALIAETLNDYLQGTSLAKPDQVREAFHSDLNLYSVDQEDKLVIKQIP